MFYCLKEKMLLGYLLIAFRSIKMGFLLNVLKKEAINAKLAPK